MPELDSSILFKSTFDIFGQFWPYFIGPIFLALVVRVLEEVLKEKEGKYFLKKYRIEFITLLFAITGYSIGLAFIAHPVITFILSVSVTLIATLVIIYAKTSEKDFYFISLNRPSQKEEWMGDGHFQYERMHNSYGITNSHSGFIFSKCLTWNDYTFDFEFKILKTSLGVILRATNLYNFIMMQIVETGIRPHIRINGFWQSWEPVDVGLIFTHKLDLDKWYRAKLQCDKKSIRIRIYEENTGKAFFDRVWVIPSGTITPTSEENTGLAIKAVLATIPFPINLEYGTAGFRNDGDEKALVKDVLIEKIQGTFISDDVLTTESSRD